MAPQEHKQFFTTGQAAELCSVTSDSVLKWIRTGRIKARRTAGGHFRIPLSELHSVISDPTLADAHETGSEAARQHLYCWEFHSGKEHSGCNCQSCVTYLTRASRCFELAHLPELKDYFKDLCPTPCAECDYYSLVKSQRPNVLILTDQSELSQSLLDKAEEADFNLQAADCEYKLATIVEGFRPDYVLIDCSIGTNRAREAARHVVADPRLPVVRVVIAGDRHDFPKECDREIFAFIERPVTLANICALVSEFKS